MKQIYILLALVGLLFPTTILSQISPSWGSPLRVNGVGNGVDSPTSLVVDGSGNVFAGGVIQEFGSTDKDWYIIKYNYSGEEVWHKQFPNAGDDYLTAMKVDALGNLYATGCMNYAATGGGRQANYYTIKISSGGVTLWDRYFSAKQGGGFDQANSIDLDENGNAYITGQCESPSTPGITDIVTIKYGSGTTGFDQATYTWATETDGGGGLTDVGKFIAATTDGYLYVAGYGAIASHSFDFLTLRYNATTGETTWTKKMDGAISLADTVTGLVVDHANNAIVTGMMRNANNDFQTVKYSPSGAVLVQKKYNYVVSDVPYGLAVDASNDVYVLGTSNRGTSKDDIIVVKYKFSTNDTTKLWECDFTNPYADIAAKIAFGTGNIINIGGSVTHDSITGPKHFFGAGINAATGAVLWSVDEPGDSLDNIVTSMAVDNSGSLYLTGKSKGASSDYDFLTQKWGYPNNTIIATAGAHGSILPGDSVLVGAGLNQRFTFAPSTGFYVDSVFVDDVWVDSTSSYTFYGVLMPHRIRVTFDKYYRTFVLLTDLGGKPNTLKVKKNKPAALPNIANWRDTAIARGGKSGIALGIQVDKKDREGLKNYGWVRFKKGADFGKFYTQIDTDRTYNAPFDTIRKSGSNKKKRFVKEFSPNIKSYTNPLIQGFGLFKLNLLSSANNVTPSGFDSLVYAAGGSPYSGMPLWQIAKSVDTALTYYKTKPLPGNDTARVGVAALQTLLELLNTINGAFDTTIALANGDSINATKHALQFPGKIRINQVSFLKHSLGAKAESGISFGSRSQSPEMFTLEQNYPNPFNPVTVIRFQISDYGLVTLKIYDVLGREVATLINNETMEVGTHEISFDASHLSSGVYFYRLTATSGGGETLSQTKKLVLLR